MGCGSSTAVSTEAQKAINLGIAEQIQAKKAAETQNVKILLLGAGECGKSTILKQMKLINLGGKFTPEEEQEAKELVFKNTVDAIQSVIGACTELAISLAGVEEECEMIMKIDTSEKIDLACGPWITKVWEHPGAKEAKSRENEFHLLDSAGYFLDKVPQYFTPDFKVTNQDVLRTRLTTTGIIETSFVIDGTTFKMYDVGGQRGERKKWIHCFDEVTAIMFIAALSEYNQVLAEDRTRNRLSESLDLFEGLVNLQWFENASVILFLNKKDIFEKKVLEHDIGKWHEDYTGGLDFEAGLNFIRDEYLDRNENEDKCIYDHVTDATNTENVSFVWKATRSIILEAKMVGSGLGM